ncbi:MAG: zinc-binding dehydrogenase, partial [Bifidobacteriaceae bacterium]|nr:zinc-binding dehydrogenase [Bifidobacteriaceae bacterium]
MNRRSTATMAALLLDRPGAPSGLRSGQAPVPAPGPGQVLVRVEAGGLNPVDYKIAAGGMPEWSWPHILGADVVGRVESVGEGVGRPVPGDRIAYHGDLRTPGGFADFAITTADTVALVPSGVDAVTAAALPCAAMTAHQAVSRRLHVRAGQTVLVTAGAGGVGGFAVQLAARVGARVIATASAANADHVRHLGAETVLDYRSQDIPERVRRLTDGRGVDAVVDAVSPVSATSLLPVLAFGGGIAAVAGRPDLRTVPSFTTAPSVHEIALGAAHSHGDAAARADLATMLGELLE